MKPPAPGPVSGDSHTNDMRTQATAASTAFPPARRTSAPALAVSSCPAATTPVMVRRLIVLPRASGLEAADAPPPQACVPRDAVRSRDLEVRPLATHDHPVAVEGEPPRAVVPLDAEDRVLAVVVGQIQRRRFAHREAACDHGHLELRVPSRAADLLGGW